MKWHKTSNRVWSAIGEDGTFIIEQQRKLFWATYVSKKNKCFRFPPTKKLSVAKEMCQDNAYWET